MAFATNRAMLSITTIALSLTFAQGCASLQVWPRPLTAINEPRPWPKPDFPGELHVDEIRESLLLLHNRARKEKNRPRLTIDSALQEAAQAHAEEMASRRTMTHKGADGSSISHRVQALGYRYKRCGENIAYGQYTPDLVMRGWLTSPPHRKNILGNFNQIGLGYAIDKDGTPYWCVTFGFPAGR